MGLYRAPGISWCVCCTCILRSWQAKHLVMLQSFVVKLLLSYTLSLNRNLPVSHDVYACTSCNFGFNPEKLYV